MCGLDPEQQRLCLRYINAAPDDEQRAVNDARDSLRAVLSVLLRRLSPGDFEQLVDLALMRAGWHRVLALVGSMKDVDLVVEQPFTGERMAVQVNPSTQRVVNECAARLAERVEDERLLIVRLAVPSRRRAPPVEVSS